ncbi:MAG: DsbA family protein [bacterium]|nr:DsbA family protein [bacterium]
MENIENNNENLEHKSTSNNKQIVAAIIVAGLIIAGAILLKDSKKPVNDLRGVEETNTKNNESKNIRPITEQDHILGNKDAKILIVEYSDTECPFCKVFHNTMHKIISENTDVAWVYRHYPIPELHSKAFNESLALECAWEFGGNEMFWQYTDEVYKRTLSNDKLPTDELSKIATDLGLNINTFSACLDSEKYSEKIEQDILDGQRIGVQGTPTSFVVKDGKIIDIIEGAQPIEKVREIIKKARY